MTLFRIGWIFFIFFGATSLTLAKSSEQKAAILKILNQYNEHEAVQMKVSRTETKKTLGTTTESEGQIIYSKNRIYFLTEKPTKIEIIYNNSVWVIESPDLELDDKAGRKVTVFDADKVSFIKTMAEVFSTPGKFLTKDTKITQEDNEITVDLNKLKSVSLKEIKIKLDKKTQRIKSLFLVDDIETQTTLTFEDTQFLNKVPKSKFNYKKLKTDEILKP